MENKNIGSFIELIETAIKEYWDLDALTDYDGATLQYKDVARKIEKLHILFSEAHVKKGDKIAICGRNSSQWAAAYLGILTYGAVAVPILQEFKPEQIYNIVNHSESKLLFVGDLIWPTIDANEMPDLEGIFGLPDYSLLVSRAETLTSARERLNEMFGHKFPKNFRKEHVSYRRDETEELAMINYTSGTTSNSKGVMIPYRALWSNMDFARSALHMCVHKGSKLVSILPMAHMYGMALEFLFEFISGAHVFFLMKNPSPTVIFNAFAKIKPDFIAAVPLILEKALRYSILPQLQTPQMRMLMRLPYVREKICNIICNKMKKAFGGKFYEIMIGGAPLNKDIEELLHRIHFPYAIVYGATECAPVICYADYSVLPKGSCGRVVKHMEVKIDSPDPQHVVGEILCRGINVMLGYYKNPEATALAIDKDGWYHTGDLAVIDEFGYIYIKGRSKNMLLGSSGQNIYPEEIEGKLNMLPLVEESVIIQKGNKFYALVYPNQEGVKERKLTLAQLKQVMEQNRRTLNGTLPMYSQISGIKIVDKEFEKTPKRSIKRFLYANYDVN